MRPGMDAKLFNHMGLTYHKVHGLKHSSKRRYILNNLYIAIYVQQSI